MSTFAFAPLATLLFLVTVLGLIPLLVTRLALSKVRRPPWHHLRIEVVGFFVSYFVYNGLIFLFGVLDAYAVGVEMTGTLVASYAVIAIVCGVLSGWVWGKTLPWIGGKI
jgi:hypothetical protein